MGGCETPSAGLTHRPPGSQHPSEPRQRQATTPAGFPHLRSSAAAGRRQARSSSPPRGCGGSSVTPDQRGDTETSSCEETQHNSQPGDNQVTGPVQHALLTAKAPMGGCSAPRNPPADAEEHEQIFGARRHGSPGQRLLSVICPVPGSRGLTRSGRLSRGSALCSSCLTCPGVRRT